jgi:hypothetical protein
MTRDEIIEEANLIAREYQLMGLKLTLRQMYYQFVSRGLTESSQKVYNRIGAALTVARYRGDFPVDGLEDRGRTVAHGDYIRDYSNVDESLSAAARNIQTLPEQLLGRARWYGQRTHVSVWVEKEALAGVFEPVCRELGVSWFACKGYPSVSALNDWIDSVSWHAGERGYGHHRMILYFGDHDPDGWQIPRSALANINKLFEVRAGRRFPVTMKRVALNMDQILRFKPEPFEAKVSSSRYRSYIDEHGTDEAWELDALDPMELQRLIRDEVGDCFDDSIYRDNEVLITQKRDEMRHAMRQPDWIAGVLGSTQ